MKRLFDVIFSVLIIILLFLPIAFLSILIRITSKGKVLYWSKRIGQDNNIFLMPKFRSMKENTPQLATDLLKNPEKYITKIGALLRKTSLDELPQIWCILIGEMSFVGPRPALFNQYDLIDMRTNKGIHKLKPGLTGWAQVNGRDNISINQKVNYDDYYLKNKSFFLDCKIIIFTLIKVIKKDDVL